MFKLIKKSVELPVEEPKKQRKAAPEAAAKKSSAKEEHAKLPPDEYRDEMEPRNIDVDDENRYIVVSVKRGGELGLLNLDLRWFQTTDVYTGFTRKGISIPLEQIDTVIKTLVGIKEEAIKKNLIEE